MPVLHMAHTRVAWPAGLLERPGVEKGFHPQGSMRWGLSFRPVLLTLSAWEEFRTWSVVWRVLPGPSTLGGLPKSLHLRPSIPLTPVSLDADI